MKYNLNLSSSTGKIYFEAPTMNLLHSSRNFIAVMTLLIILVPGYHAFAESTINCHCFQDRSFDPADKFASDDYILATSFNSLLARSFTISKEQVVRLKMEEKVGQDDLLIGLKLTKITGGYLDQLLGLSGAGYTWPQIINGMEHQNPINNDKLAQDIKSGIPVGVAGDRVADEMISEFYAIPTEDVERYRAYGLSEKEIGLVLVLAHFKDAEPETFVDQYKKQGSSWSEIAFTMGLEPSAAGKLVLAFPAKQLSE
jgi:hypothetical protein